MKRTIIYLAAAALLTALSPARVVSGERTAPLIIDHTCTDINGIPADILDAARRNTNFHFVRLSHGRQINVGLVMLEDSDPVYDTERDDGALAVAEDALCMFIAAGSPSEYWRGSGIDMTRSVLDANPEMTVSGFCWCTDLNTASESFVAEYLAAMSILESEYPDVTFVYFTGTAEYDGGYGHNRFLRNEQIRKYCIENNKVLYDFADLDSWYYYPESGQWEHSTYQYEGITVPVEHPQLAGAEINHTTYASCLLKGKALWSMMASLQGWQGTLDIAITSFTATFREEAVSLRWDYSATEECFGFNIYRSDDNGLRFVRINSSLIVPQERISYIDRDVRPGTTYIYRIGAVAGEREFTSLEISVSTTGPDMLQLYNYPNPCNPSTTIAFTIDIPRAAKLVIFDAAGRKVSTLLDEDLGAGTHTVAWDGKNDNGDNVNSGVYFYRLTAGKESRTCKLLLLR